jgi:curli biogenesis system outer membrane secretion channel CsgG
MPPFVRKKFACSTIAFLFLCGCASGGVKDTSSPTISEAQDISPTGPKARIAVAQFVNHSGGWEAQAQRMQAQIQAQNQRDARMFQEYQRHAMAYSGALLEWHAKVNAVGLEKAGPAPKAPEFESTASPYMATISDPVAGAMREMMIKALFSCGKFIILERQEIDKITWEHEFSKTGSVGQKTAIPEGKIEGVELLVIGSLTALDANQSGGNVGGVMSSVISFLPFVNIPYVTETSAANVSWESAKAAMEIRLVDARTSRIVAAFTAEGTATSAGVGASRSKYTYNAGELPQGFSLYKNTPVEEAFRKMIDVAVQTLITKTPAIYYHSE